MCLSSLLYVDANHLRTASSLSVSLVSTTGSTCPFSPWFVLLLGARLFFFFSSRYAPFNRRVNDKVRKTISEGDTPLGGAPSVLGDDAPPARSRALHPLDRHVLPSPRCGSCWGGECEGGKGRDLLPDPTHQVCDHARNRRAPCASYFSLLLDLSSGRHHGLQPASLEATNPRSTTTNPLTKQTSDQATPRQTTFFTFQQLRQRATSWHQPLWVAAIDFKKAFDAVEHSSVWMAMREQCIEEPYVQLLTKLYDQQRASVHTDVKSKHFHLEQGTKQEDPLQLLFKSLLQYHETTNMKVDEM